MSNPRTRVVILVGAGALTGSALSEALFQDIGAKLVAGLTMHPLEEDQAFLNTPSKKLSPEEETVLKVLYSETKYDMTYVLPFRPIMLRTGLIRPIVRRACRSLARKGYAQYVKGLQTDDGDFAGAGYCITRLGLVRGVEIDS